MTTIGIPDGSPFGTDNLPYGVFSVAGEAPRVGVRVGDSVVDLATALGTDGLDAAFAAPVLNPFMAQGRPRWVEVRERVTTLVTGDVPDAAVHAVRDVVLHLPFAVADYVDFYASEHHAANLGRLFRPGTDPLTPNWKHLPIGYHGRSVQAWEYVPLGPFLGKSFATSVSPWVVPLLALEAARVPLPGQVPAPLPYLAETRSWGLDVDLEVEWNGEVVSRPPYREMYWSPAQMLAHMTVNGASARTGDLFASGTISGPEKHQRGAFIELTWNGQEPVTVKGEERTFLLDGDEVVLTGTAPGAGGGRIGFGEVRGRIVAAP